MFTADTYIDTVTDASTKFVKTYVTNEGFKNELVKLLESQSAFAKGSIKSTIALTQEIYSNNANAFFKAAK